MRQSLIPMSDHLPVRESKMTEQLPESIMKKAVRGIGYIAHPLRLRILEYIDVNGASSASCAKPDWLKPSGAAFLFIIIYMRNIRPAFLFVFANCLDI